MRDPRIDLAVGLVQLENPDAEVSKIVQEVMKEFGISCTKEDVNAIYAAYLPDNFEAESNLIQHYERDFMYQYE